MQQPVIRVRGDAVDLVVRGHDARTLAQCIAAANGGKKVSRSVRSEMLAGPTLVPLSGWPWPVMCLSVAKTLPSASGSVSPCSPRTAAMPSWPTRYGSSPKVSSIRPQRGSRATSTTGASTRWTPRARISRAAIVNTRVTSSGSQELASAIACGKLVASRRRSRAGLPRGTVPGCPAACVPAHSAGWR